MNIWILNHYAIPPDTPGGTRHYDFARELVKQRHRVSIFASSFSHDNRKEERLGINQNYRRGNINGVEFLWVRTFPYYGGNDWRRAVNMLSYGLRVVPIGIVFKEKPDIILASSPHPFAGLAGWLLAKFKSTAFIFEVRDLWPETFVKIGGYSGKSPVVKLLGMLEKFLYHKARKIIVLLPKASEYIESLGISSDKIVYIPNGVNPELFVNTSAQLPEGLDELISSLKSQGKFLVGYTGAHGAADGLETLIETAKLLQGRGVSKIHLLLVGDGAEKSRLKEKAQSWGLNNISFFNPIQKNAMPALLRLIDIATVPLRKSPLWEYGTSKNKLFDSMLCSRPIVWAINSANDPVAESGCGITVPPEEAEAMAKAIMKLCNMRERERQEMGKKGYEYVMKNHAVPILAKKLLAVMEEAIQRFEKE